MMKIPVYYVLIADGVFSHVPGSTATIMMGYFMFSVFYYIETLPRNPNDALIAPSTWRLPNFALLSAMTLVVPFW
jgi:hypothetical protein